MVRWKEALFIFLCLIHNALSLDFNPYHVLGLKKGAKEEEIKRAYRDKAKQWHPDKNSEANAQEKFLQVQEAYEILTDPQKREEYDRSGTVDSGNRQQQNPYSSFFRNTYQRYYDSTANSDSHVTKLTSWNYDHLIYSTGGDSSLLRVWLIYAYSDYCASCERILAQWEEAAKSLKGIVRLGKIHTDFEMELARKLGIRSVPSIWAVAVQDGRSKIYYSNINSRSPQKDYAARAVIEFASSIYDKFASSSKIHLITDGLGLDSLERKLEQFTKTQRRDSPEKVQVLILSTRSDPHIVFRSFAQRFKDTMIFAHICLGCLDTNPTIQAEGANLISPQLQSLLKDGSDDWNPSKAALIIRREPDMPDLILPNVKSDPDILFDTLWKYRFLHVPKLNGENFYELCYQPKSINCLIVVAESQAEARTKLLPLFRSDSSVHRMLRHASNPDGPIQSGWVQSNVQKEFVSFFNAQKKSQKNCMNGPLGQSSIIAIKTSTGQAQVFFEGGATPSEDLEIFISQLTEIDSPCSLLKDDVNEKAKKKIDSIPFLNSDPETSRVSFFNFFSQDSSSFLNTASLLFENGSFFFTITMVFVLFFLTTRTLAGGM